jgi:hypothetical protein
MIPAVVSKGITAVKQVPLIPSDPIIRIEEETISQSSFHGHDIPAPVSDCPWNLESDISEWSPTVDGDYDAWGDWEVSKSSSESWSLSVQVRHEIHTLRTEPGLKLSRRSATGILCSRVGELATLLWCPVTLPSYPLIAELGSKGTVLLAPTVGSSMSCPLKCAVYRYVLLRAFLTLSYGLPKELIRE